MLSIKHAFIILFASIYASSEAFGTQYKFYDLGYSVNNETIYYPGLPSFSVNKNFLGLNEKIGYWYAAFSYCIGEHGGSHVDAPFHFSKDGHTIDQIPQENLINVPAFLIDVDEHVRRLGSEENQGKFALTVEHLVEYEKKMKRQIPRGSVLLVRTGWARFWPNKLKYLGWNNSTDGQEKLNFPGLSIDAAQWLQNERSIVGLGIDTPCIDPGHTEGFPVHVFLAKRQVYNIENLANLHLLPESDQHCHLRLFVMPIKFIGATGSPARILAYCK